MKASKQILGETEKLSKENAALRHELQEANNYIGAIKSGTIDALVIGTKKDAKVYTEKTSDKTYRILIEQMHEGAVTLATDGTILYSNSHFATMVNLPLQKVIGAKFSTYIDDSSKASFGALFKTGWKRNAQKEINLRTQTDKIIPTQLSVNAISLDSDSSLCMILTDLSLLKQNEEELKSKATLLEQINHELENANKDLTAFTFVSSHDLQEPLRKIQNFVSVIFKDGETKLSDNSKVYFQRLREVAKRMQALIEDLLIYSHAKNTERKFEKTDLDTLVKEVKKEYEETFQKENGTIETVDLGEVNIIQLQFRQLLHNLISNSLKFAKREVAPHIHMKSEVVQGSKLNVEKLLPETDYCHITYTDNGIGFDPQYNERIFEVFQRLYSREEYKGTGMGLAICKRIIENHNGVITASGEFGVGTRFDIYIPA